MPSCCIKNCKSHTFYTDKKNITFFRFPKEKVILEKWINACGKSEDNTKIISGRIRSLHFEDDCFVMRWTQPKSAKTCMKQMKRLKEGSIPTKMLLLDKSRKRRNKKGTMSDSDHVSVMTGKMLNTETSKQQMSELSTCLQIECIEENIYSEEDNFDKQNSLISLNDVLRENEYILVF
ncbi:uncharacterized protein LOC112588705 [Harpegnathos saltator]|uniref:uncharacterized protein LOC112588705 n=1 Tax=Harpegnathos saltator TaxID=610380 RepID=UPI000DBEDBB4|nr:uncharacterized protein LOC112588705 [Harpegnathos saltator]